MSLNRSLDISLSSLTGFAFFDALFWAAVKLYTGAAAALFGPALLVNKLQTVRLRPFAGILPFPTSVRSVSGKKSVTGMSTEPERIARNQNIALLERRASRDLYNLRRVQRYDLPPAPRLVENAAE